MSTALQETFTPTEAAALVELSAKRIRKEFEQQVIKVNSPPRISFTALVYLRALKIMSINLPVATRSEMYERLAHAIERSKRVESVQIAELLTLQVGSVIKNLQDRINRFRKWQQNLVERPDVMGGETVFPNSRLTVRHVGEMLERGESPEVILEDYPYLTPEDLELSRIYAKAYPRVGRPKSEHQDSD